MPLTIDGDNLVITLESGVTEVDVFEDIYEPVKAWYLGHPDNRVFPFPFVSDGGAPLTSIINQGSYIFLRNDVGWRLRPPEEDITIYLVGNLAVSDTALPAFIPTVGAYTAAILGLQPITQGVTPSMSSQLAFNVFQGMVCVDQANGLAGTGLAPNGLDPIGSRKAPSNNIADTLTIAINNGLNILNFMTTGSIASGDFSAGYIIRADNLQTAITVSAPADVRNCTFTHCNLTGEVDGLNQITEAEIVNITDCSGEVSRCDLEGAIGVNGSIHVYQCFSGIAALSYPSLTGIGANEVIVRDMRGSIGVAGMTGGTHSIGVYGGRLVVEADCTGGIIYVRGDPYEITDLSGGAVTLVDQTASQKVSEIWTRLDTNPDLPNTYADDGSYIVNPDFTLTKTDNGNGTFTINRSG